MYTTPPGSTVARCASYCSHCEDYHFSEPWPCAKERKSEVKKEVKGLAKSDLCEESKAYLKETRRARAAAHPTSASIALAESEPEPQKNPVMFKNSGFLSLILGGAKANSISD